MLGEFLTRLRFFISRERPVDIDDELQFHIDQSTQTNIAAGMTPEEARRQAGIVFGGFERAREQCYEQRPGRLLESILQDVRFALRWLARNPNDIVGGPTLVRDNCFAITARKAVPTLVATSIKMKSVADP